MKSMKAVYFDNLKEANIDVIQNVSGECMKLFNFL
jgi:hypothetical protein